MYRTGAIKDGYTEPATLNFKAIPGDSNRNVVILAVWEAGCVLSDTGIIPVGNSDADYDFKIPLNAEGTFIIISELYY